MAVVECPKCGMALTVAAGIASVKCSGCGTTLRLKAAQPPPANSVAEWHYADSDGAQQGPVPKDTIHQLLRIGAATLETLVWRDGMAEWQPLRNTELAAAIPTARGGTPPTDDRAAPRSSAPSAGALRSPQSEPLRGGKTMVAERITRFEQCVSKEERKQRLGVTLISLLAWAVMVVFTILTVGVFLVLAAVTWVVNYLLAEVNVRRLQALGATVSQDQFPPVYRALTEVRERFGMKHHVRVIVVASGETNAFAIRFARKRVVVILSELLEGIIDNPEQLRALLGHELCHQALDHGPRRFLELYKPVKYRAARELTCDNAALAASGNLEATTELVKKLCVGKRLYTHLSEEAMILESNYIYSGLVGYFVRRQLTHPPAGARVLNLRNFAADADSSAA